MTTLTPWLAAALFAASAAQAQPEAALTLPFTLTAGLPMLQARIDGRDAKLLLDAGGAAALALRPDWAPVSDAASAVMSQDALGQVRRNGSLVVGTVALAGHTLPAAPAAQTWGKGKPPLGADGYLGWGWLRERRWAVDYAAQQLQLLAPGEAMPAGCGTAPARFEMLGSLPVLRLQAADGQALTLGLDTGASRNVIRPALAAAVAGELRWAGQPLAAGSFVTVPLRVPGLDGFLGQDFFSRHRVCMDPAAQQLWVQPLAN